ncbi:hypothetical protein TNCT_109561 [Trichonephila clavata]|uniref:Uncharacterized protein n=1 Tax=Trichonephila clavata TaxID=2740835 RepID=A0A8X6FDP5_TRICU|nr:hypothetical protein TNCT_109561 [Trichonephila clavata]
MRGGAFVNQKGKIVSSPLAEWSISDHVFSMTFNPMIESRQGGGDFWPSRYLNEIFLLFILSVDQDVDLIRRVSLRSVTNFDSLLRMATMKIDSPIDNCHCGECRELGLRPMRYLSLFIYNS